MKWKQKARIQRLIARLPSNLSYAAYYRLQRSWGGLRNADPTYFIEAAVEFARTIRQQGQSIESKTFLEIGTGRQVTLPLSLWLLGASRVITVDLNPYLKAEMVFEAISYMRNHPQEITKLFAEYQSPALIARFNQLMRADEKLEQLLSMANIQYAAPADASRLELESRCVDYHVSFTTFEHIPQKGLESILQEGKRILRSGGLFVHCIDFSDHFSHSDPSICAINCLQFSDQEWDQWAGNRYMYQNRLRADDIERLFREADLEILSADATINRKSLDAIKEGFALDARFKKKNPEINATTVVWLVAKDAHT